MLINCLIYDTHQILKDVALNISQTSIRGTNTFVDRSIDPLTSPYELRIFEWDNNHKQINKIYLSVYPSSLSTIHPSFRPSVRKSTSSSIFLSISFFPFFLKGCTYVMTNRNFWVCESYILTLTQSKEFAVAWFLSICNL